MRASSSRRDERSSSIASRPPLVRRLYPSYLSARRLPGKLPLHYSHSTGQTRRSKNHQANQMVFRSFRCARYCASDSAGKYAPDMGRQLLAYADLPVTIDVSWAFAPTGQIEGFVPGGVEVGEKNRYSAFKLDASLVWGAEHSGAEFAPVHYAQPVALYLGRAAQV